MAINDATATASSGKQQDTLRVSETEGGRTPPIDGSPGTEPEAGREKHPCSFVVTLAERRSWAEAWVVDHRCGDGRGVLVPFAFKRGTKRGDLVGLVAEAIRQAQAGCTRG